MLPNLRKPTRTKKASSPVSGLHLEQSEAIAAVASLDGGLGVERAAAVDLPLGAVRDGEVIDPEALGAALKRLFAEHRLPKRVRVGIANHRTLMRTIDLPPLERESEIAAAVRLHAPEHIPMPLDQAVTDHHVLGLVDTPEGPRMRVVVVATDRASIDRLLEALRIAGLRPAGVDLSAFALIRALDGAAPVADDDEAGSKEDAVLYAHVAGTTTLAIAQGSDCRFTRVSAAGFDTFTAQLAERAAIPVDEARHRLLVAGAEDTTDVLARAVIDAGADHLGDDLRTSIEFYAGQWGGSIKSIVLTGTALAVPGFAEAVEKRSGLPVIAGEVKGSAQALGGLEPWRVTLATGLSIEEVAA
jgi:type IV pilus assembly protein PilM